MQEANERTSIERTRQGDFDVEVFMIGPGDFTVEIRAGQVTHAIDNIENRMRALGVGEAWASNHRLVGERIAGAEWDEKSSEYVGVVYDPAGWRESFPGYVDRELAIRDMVELAKSRNSGDPVPTSMAEGPADVSPEAVAAAAKEAEQTLRAAGKFDKPVEPAPAPTPAIQTPSNADEIWTLMAAERDARRRRDDAKRALDRAKAHATAAEKDYEEAVRLREEAYEQANRQRELPLAPAPKPAAALPASPIAWAFNGRDFKIAWTRQGERFHVEVTDAGKAVAEDAGENLEASIERVKSAVSDLYADADPGEAPTEKPKRGRGKKDAAPTEPAASPKTTRKKDGPGRGGRRSKAGLTAVVTEG